MAQPSPLRISQAAGHRLRDELLIVIGTPAHPGTRKEAQNAAARAGGVIAGGFGDLGVYQIRWPTPQNLPARGAELRRAPGVTAVDPSLVGLYGADSAYTPTVQSTFDDPYWTWRFDHVDAPQAWAQATGSAVTVGVVDVGNVFSAHPGLNVVASLDPIQVPSAHATHVAGLACARAGNEGMSGVAWGCPIVTASAFQVTSTEVLGAMRAVASRRDVRVVNSSLGVVPPQGGCATAAQAAETANLVTADAPAFRQLFEGVGGHVVWTFSAGNLCLGSVHSAWG
jgi:hypothetical protein